MPLHYYGPRTYASWMFAGTNYKTVGWPLLWDVNDIRYHIEGMIVNRRAAERALREKLRTPQIMTTTTRNNPTYDRAETIIPNLAFCKKGRQGEVQRRSGRRFAFREVTVGSIS
jgi:hypothetical protein